MLNSLHILRELPKDIKAQTSVNPGYRTLVQAGTTHDAPHLGTSADTTLKGSEIFIQSNEVSVTAFKSVYFTLQQSCCTTWHTGVLRLRTKPQVAVK